jgi:site-specific recombinase XerD
MVRAAERTLSTVFTRAEVKDAHAHRFRHTLATELLEKGWTYLKRAIQTPARKACRACRTAALSGAVS